MNMSDKEYQRYSSFMSNKRLFVAQRTPAQKAHFYEQVKRRVINFLEATGKKNLATVLASKFWLDSTMHSFDINKAWEEAIELGYVVDGMPMKDSPYFWYDLIKPRALKLAKDAKAFTRHFDKLQETN